jgi:hypothetical protein
MAEDMTIPEVSRLEVIRTGARRRWTLEEKRRMVSNMRIPMIAPGYSDLVSPRIPR